MEKTKMASFFSDRCVVHSVTLRIVHASSWVDADRCHDSMMTKTSWWFAQIWCRINKKGIKERKKDWKTKLTYQLSSTYISKIASWCVQRCHPGCNVPSLSSRTNVTRANAPQHPVLTASFASFDSGCNFRPMQPISQTKKFCNAKTFGEKSLILESLGKFGYDLVSHFIHICSFPFFASLCCYVLFDFSVVSISLPTRGLSRYPQPQASTYVQPNAWFLPNQDSKMICLDELLLKKNSKSCEVFCWESMWSIFRQDLQLMQLDSDRARLWSERSDVKCVKWLWFSCDFHVVDLSRRSNCFTEAAAAGHATGRATAAAGNAGNAGHAAAGAAGDAAGNASSTHDAHSTTTDADGAELKVKDSKWLKEKNRVMEASIFNLKQWNTEAPDGIHAGSLNFGVRGPQKKLPKRKKRKKHKKQQKASKLRKTSWKTSDLLYLT